MGWFHLFSKIKVVGNNFLSEQTVGWLILLGMVVNRGFLGCAAWLLLLGGFQNCWCFTRLSLSSLTQTNVVLPGLGWPRSSLESTLRTEGSVEEILKQNWFSFSSKHLIICICRAKPGWGVSTRTTGERSSFGAGISHLGCQRKCLPGPLQPVLHCCCRDGHPYHGISSLFTETHPNLICIKQFCRTPWFWVETLEHPIHLNQQQKWEGNQMHCANLDTRPSIFTPENLRELYLCLYLKKAAHNQGLQTPNLNCNYQLTQAIFGHPFSHTTTGFCLYFISYLFRESDTQMGADQLTQNPECPVLLQQAFGKGWTQPQLFLLCLDADVAFVVSKCLLLMKQPGLWYDILGKTK